MTGDRARLGALGEEIAARFLSRRGGVVVARNVEIGGGEVDLVVRWGRSHAAVEVRTVGSGAVAEDPLDRITDAKLAQVSRLAGLLRPRFGPMRVDFVGVKVADDGAAVRWIADIA